MSKKICTMNCSPGPGNKRSLAERQRTCEDCLTERTTVINTQVGEKPGAQHLLPIGAVVIFEHKLEWDGNHHLAGDRARMVIVQHSRDCDGTPLYMAAKHPVAPPTDDYKLYSKGYLAYRLSAGWFVGNCSISAFVDTGDRMEVQRFDVETYCSGPQE